LVYEINNLDIFIGKGPYLIGAVGINFFGISSGRGI
jgi:hypothetical protein